MKLTLRGKAGKPLQVVGDDGKVIEGVTGIHVNVADGSLKPEVVIRVQVAVAVEAEAEVINEQPAAGADAE